MINQTILTLQYKDKLGRPKEFVCSDHLKENDQGQSTDEEVKRQMKRLGIKKCRVKYRDYTTSYEPLIKGSIYKYPVPYLLRPNRPERTITL